MSEVAPSFQKFVVRRAVEVKGQFRHDVAPCDHHRRPMAGRRRIFQKGGPSTRKETGVVAMRMAFLPSLFLPSMPENPTAWHVTRNWEKHQDPILLKRKWRSLPKVCPGKLNWMPQHGGEAQGLGQFDFVTQDVRPGGQGNTGPVYTCVAKR